MARTKARDADDSSNRRKALAHTSVLGPGTDWWHNWLPFGGRPFLFSFGNKRQKSKLSADFQSSIVEILQLAVSKLAACKRKQSVYTVACKHRLAPTYGLPEIIPNLVRTDFNFNPPLLGTYVPARFWLDSGRFRCPLI